jgi:hypothetical protein
MPKLGHLGNGALGKVVRYASAGRHILTCIESEEAVWHGTA